MVESAHVRETTAMSEKTRMRARIKTMCNYYPEFVEKCDWCNYSYTSEVAGF